MKQHKKKVTLFAENIGESSAACLVAMVQGNILAVGAIVGRFRRF